MAYFGAVFQSSGYQIRNYKEETDRTVTEALERMRSLSVSNSIDFPDLCNYNLMIDSCKILIILNLSY